MMRAFPVLAAALGLAACSPSVPDSAAGVGFGDYNSYIRGAPPAPAAPLNPTGVGAAPATTAPASGFSPANAAAAIDRATGAAPATGGVIGAAPAPMASTLAPAPMQTATLDANGQRPRGNAPEGIKEEMGEMVHAGISDEQDFEAVKQRETIESDKARIERNRSQYVVDQPTALPQRSGEAAVSAAIQFALATTHQVGSPMYKRSGLKFAKPDAACLKYNTDMEAQEDFLASGGPERDRKGVDPDGDGFACGWNPAPFRAAKQ